MNILFICTHNRCRSIVAEAVGNHVRQLHERNDIHFASAGSEPEGHVFPGAIEHLEGHGISTDGLRSKSWDELEDFNADIVIPVCDKAAGEACPLFLAPALRIQWPLSDPSKIALDPASTPEQANSAFAALISTLTQRIETMIQIIDSTPDLQQLDERLQAVAD
ncbi:Glutaredoxin arsenate reductase [BD1-7 clade bacterium]|uniref:Glutaredoxin arsenate reductase n=1 Tax=BD1-7 clade bacterium TaxID=2029982 RepID=A0A5S9QS32_9GAMM|nr:Glutaredoxin arsenate reductase [BD1-7 clade bacterium]